MSFVAIIGSGALGGAVAQTLALRDRVRASIRLIDSEDRVARGRRSTSSSQRRSSGVDRARVRRDRFHGGRGRSGHRHRRSRRPDRRVAVKRASLLRRLSAIDPTRQSCSRARTLAICWRSPIASCAPKSAALRWQRPRRARLGRARDGSRRRRLLCRRRGAGRRGSSGSWILAWTECTVAVLPSPPRRPHTCWRRSSGTRRRAGRQARMRSARLLRAWLRGFSRARAAASRYSPCWTASPTPAGSSPPCPPRSVCQESGRCILRTSARASRVMLDTALSRG